MHLLAAWLFPVAPVEAALLAQERFEVTFYPNSVFIIPLSTNQLYTHETCPAGLSAT